MTARPIIRVGDKTTHGGTVLEGFSSYSIDCRAAAGEAVKTGQKKFMTVNGSEWSTCGFSEIQFASCLPCNIADHGRR